MDDFPLHSAVRDNCSGIVRTLLEQGADPNLQDASGETPLHICCRMSNRNLMEIILHDQRVDPNIQARSGETPLHLIAGKDPQMIILLLKQGADPVIADTFSRLPAHIAVKDGDLDCLKAVLEHSNFAPPWPRQYQSLLEAARKAGKRDMESYLYQWEISLAQAHHMHLLAHSGHWSEVEKMIAQDHALVDVRDDFGRTPLHIASWMGDLEGVLMLLEAGADPNARLKASPFEDRRFVTPLHFSLVKGFPAVSFALIERGAIVKDLQEPLFLERVIRSQDLALLETLLIKGIPPNPGKPGRSPLWVAGEEDSLAMVELLLKYGAEPNHPAHAGGSLEEIRNPLVKKLLRDHGGRVNPQGEGHICQLCGNSFAAPSPSGVPIVVRKIDVDCARCGARVCSICSYPFEQPANHVKKMCLNCYKADFKTPGQQRPGE